MSRRSAFQHSPRAAPLQLTLCPLPKAVPLAGMLPWVQASGIHPSTLQSGTLFVPFSLRHYHETWQLFPRHPLLDGACQGPPVVFPASHLGNFMGTPTGGLIMSCTRSRMGDVPMATGQVFERLYHRILSRDFVTGLRDGSVSTAWT